MELYLENVEEYLSEYSTLNQTVIFNLEGEVLFSEPEETEFGSNHLRAVLNCMADRLHTLVGLQVGDNLYKCLRVDNTLIVGRTDTEEFVAYRTQDVVIIGVNDRDKTGESCLKDVKDVASVLFQPPVWEGDLEVPVEDDVQQVTNTQTMLACTTPSPHLRKAKVGFKERNSPAQQRNSKIKLIHRDLGLPEDQSNDFEVVNMAFDSNIDDEASFEKIELQEAPHVSQEDVELNPRNSDLTQGM